MPCPHDRQQCIGPHRQSDMPIPPYPTADFIVIQADVAFGGFKTALNRPAGAGHVHCLCQGGGLRGKDDKGRQLRRLTYTTPDQQPAAPRRRHGGGQKQPVPVIPAGAFRTRASTAPRPAIHGQRREHRFDLLLPPAQPARRLARDGQPVGMFILFQPHSQPSVIAIDAVPGHPTGGHPRLEGLLQHAPCQRWLRGKRAFWRNPHQSAARTIIGPLLGEIQGAIEQSLPSSTRLGEKHPDLRVLHPACGATILTRDPRRMAPFVQKPRLVDDHDALGSAQMLHEIPTQIVSHGLRIPYGPPQQMLDPIGPALSTCA